MVEIIGTLYLDQGLLRGPLLDQGLFTARDPFHFLSFFITIIIMYTLYFGYLLEPCNVLFILDIICCEKQNIMHEVAFYYISIKFK